MQLQEVRRLQRRLPVKYGIIAVMVFALSFGLGTIITRQIMNVGLLGLLSGSLSGSESISGDRVNILIIGQDARPNENVTRSDTMIVASIDPELKKAVLLWIPRDTKWVTSKYGTQKINASNSFGGPELCREAIEDLLDIKIDYYVQLNFEAFKKVVDGLGGVEIDVEDYLYHADPENPDLEIDLEPGLQTLNGQQSLAYVRYRGYPMGDVDRDSHQAIFMKALVKKALSPLTVIKLPELVMAVQESLVTDMSITDMAKYVSWAPAFDSESIITQTLPGFYQNGYDGNGNLIWCYWKTDEDKTGTIIEDLFAGKTFEAYDLDAEGDDYSGSQSNSYSRNDSEGSDDDDDSGKEDPSGSQPADRDNNNTSINDHHDNEPGNDRPSDNMSDDDPDETAVNNRNEDQESSLPADDHNSTPGSSLEPGSH